MKLDQASVEVVRALDDAGPCGVREFKVILALLGIVIGFQTYPVNVSKDRISTIFGDVSREQKSALFQPRMDGKQVSSHRLKDWRRELQGDRHGHPPWRNRAEKPNAKLRRLAPEAGLAPARHAPSSGPQENNPHASGGNGGFSPTGS